MNLIIFDIDETLTKSGEQHKTAYVKSMKEIGIIRINQNWQEYPHHTDSFILKTNYENNFNIEFDVGLINNFEKCND
jgi:beta-phosphoglucomutase-like phosphatase (HAD superfamily)